MTILGPLLMASMFIVPVLLASYSGSEVSSIKVIDESGLFADRLTNTSSMTFEQDSVSLAIAKEMYDPELYTAILYIPSDVMENTSGVMMFSAKQPNLNQVTVIERTIQKEVESMKLQVQGIDQATLDKIKTKVRINTRTLSGSEEEESNAGLTFAVGFIGAMLIYMFIFLYGAQVMRGVIEEKTSRIVEVIISSVRPFQLMMGKIIGIALVGLTQFLLWVVLTFAIATTVTSLFLDPQQMREQMTQRVPMNGVAGDEAQESTQEINSELSGVMNAIGSINFPLLIGAFLFYFLGGYLLYGALFAAIGAAVDAESDTQQFMLPITIPLILSIVVSQSILQNPDSPLAFWFSMIPFTSPVIMMVRIPFGVPAWQLGLSMLLMVGGFIFTTWLAARIYRTGILMYGKKVSWRELGKWLFYKD